MREKLRRFMAGRNGFDQLCMAQAALALVLSLLSRLTRRDFFALLSSILVVWMLYRALSRDVGRRQGENMRFLGTGSRIRSDVNGWIARQKQRREFRFFRCPGCRNWLRVPRGKGGIQITCPRCGHRFSGRT